MAAPLSLRRPRSLAILAAASAALGLSCLGPGAPCMGATTDSHAATVTVAPTPARVGERLEVAVRYQGDVLDSSHRLNAELSGPGNRATGFPLLSRFPRDAQLPDQAILGMRIADPRTLLVEVQIPTTLARGDPSGPPEGEYLLQTLATADDCVAHEAFVDFAVSAP